MRAERNCGLALGLTPDFDRGPAPGGRAIGTIWNYTFIACAGVRIADKCDARARGRPCKRCAGRSGCVWLRQEGYDTFLHTAPAGASPPCRATGCCSPLQTYNTLGHPVTRTHLYSRSRGTTLVGCLLMHVVSSCELRLYHLAHAPVILRFTPRPSYSLYTALHSLYSSSTLCVEI